MTSSKFIVSNEAMALHKVAMVTEKHLENELFSRSGKSQGILWLIREIWKSYDFKRQGKVREFET